MQRILSLLAALAVFNSSAVVSAYKDNCKGSSEKPKPEDCQLALDNIYGGEVYEDLAQFSEGTCFLQYDTNGSGAHPIDGWSIKEIAVAILDVCAENGIHGSMGTGNCEECHVKINYRRWAFTGASAVNAVERDQPMG
ncbi:hypothetical protein LTR37_006147 [Vermiconidia calcicola]|uniref:Uncharacterized protein n=1 Tax=Vermiconidia calcicola TaxID=1690605 RepID=A0ACC3NHC6_9PEZI|nr:hypothetical protein LTR37_006147 [Vermiconidia calcicola]